MHLTYANGIFNCICTYHEKDYPKAAGFVWDKITPKTWATKDASVAYKLIKVANKEALEAITKYMAKATENMKASRAKNADVNIPCPAGIEYINFQKAGIIYCYNQLKESSHHSILIGDEMGTGKSVEACGIINCIQAYDIPKPMILIVCPASLKLNWRSELNKWLVKKNDIGVVNADSPWPRANIFICNYDILVQPCPICRGHTKEEKKLCSTCSGTGSYAKFPQLYDMEWDLIVADESQRLKGNRGKQASAFFKMKTKWKLPMTGTPLLSRPIEIWSTLNWLDKNTWGNRFMFGKRYCNLQQTRFGMDFNGASNLPELQNRMRGGGYLLRRLRVDVLPELPLKFRQVIELPSEGLEQVIDAEWKAYHKYESFLESLKVAYQLAKASESESEYHGAVEALRNGQNAAFTEMALIRKEVAIKKLPYVIQHLKDVVEESHKVICFCWHREIVARTADTFNPHAVIITGETQVDHRHGIVQSFQTDKNIHLFIGNMKAAGVGITLTASCHVVFAELDWVPANITQAEDRALRIGQKNNVLVQHLVLEGSLDAVMAKRIIQKQVIITKALDAPCDVESMELELMPETDVATANTSRKEVIVKSVALTDANISIIHTGLQMLSALCDGAHSLDGVGFSKIDVMIGKSLAMSRRLTQKQAYIGHKLCTRHHKQLPGEIQEALKGMVI